MSEFDTTECIKWIHEQNGYVDGRELQEKFPNFPWHNVPAGITKPLVDGEFTYYYKDDLIRAAKGIPNND